jgi:hypothetical protein
MISVAHHMQSSAGTPARRTIHRGTPYLHHLLNIIGGMKSKATMSTLMVGTPQVLGTYDMKGYINQGVGITQLSRKYPTLRVH